VACFVEGPGVYLCGGVAAAAPRSPSDPTGASDGPGCQEGGKSVGLGCSDVGCGWRAGHAKVKSHHALARAAEALHEIVSIVVRPDSDVIDGEQLHAHAQPGLLRIGARSDAGDVGVLVALSRGEEDAQRHAGSALHRERHRRGNIVDPKLRATERAQDRGVRRLLGGVEPQALPAELVPTVRNEQWGVECRGCNKANRAVAFVLFGRLQGDVATGIL
jgi:hypothetical protein